MEFLPGHWSRGRPRRGCAAAQPRCSAAFSCPRGQPAPSDALGAPPRAQSSAARGRRHRSWDQRQAALYAHDGGLVGQGRSPGLGFLQRAADATAGSRHTRPRGSQGAHAGARGGKMRVILRRIQRAYFRRNRRAGSRATSFAVRHRRRVHAHMHFSAVFHTKTLPVLGRSRVAEQRRCVGGVRAGPRDRPGAARTGEGWWGRRGPGFLQRFTGATAGSRHSRPRDSQGAHVGALGGKMRTILRHI